MSEPSPASCLDAIAAADRGRCMPGRHAVSMGSMYGVSGSDGSTTVKEGSSQVRRCTTGGAGVGCSEEVPEGDEHIAARALSLFVFMFRSVVYRCGAEGTRCCHAGHGRMREIGMWHTAMDDASREGIQ